MLNLDILFMDLDGTLLSPDHRTVSPRNRKALAMAQAAGIRLSLATGRCLGMLPVGVMSLGLDYAMTSNGAAIYDLKANRQIYHYPFPAALAEKACEIICRHVEFFECFVNGNVRLIRSPAAKLAGHTMPPWGQIVLERRGSLPPLAEMEPYLADGVPGLEKINLLHCTPETLMALQRELGDTGLFDLSSSMGYGGLEIMPVECTKGSALPWLCRHIGSSPERAAAFGDSSNDRGMLCAAGYGVAMGNAPAELRESADYVAPPYDEDGIARFIEQHLLKA